MGKTIVYGRFEWEENKALLNERKHGIAFIDILTIFDDPLFWEQFDEAHSTEDEHRFIGVGKLKGIAVIVSCYTEKGNKIRIISARISSKEEERRYENWCRQYYN